MQIDSFKKKLFPTLMPRDGGTGREKWNHLPRELKPESIHTTNHGEGRKIKKPDRTQTLPNSWTGSPADWGIQGGDQRGPECVSCEVHAQVHFPSKPRVPVLKPAKLHRTCSTSWSNCLGKTWRIRRWKNQNYTIISEVLGQMYSLSVNQLTER